MESMQALVVSAHSDRTGHTRRRPEGGRRAGGRRRERDARGRGPERAGYRRAGARPQAQRTRRRRPALPRSIPPCPPRPTRSTTPSAATSPTCCATPAATSGRPPSCSASPARRCCTRCASTASSRHAPEHPHPAEARHQHLGRRIAPPHPVAPVGHTDREAVGRVGERVRRGLEGGAVGARARRLPRGARRIAPAHHQRVAGAARAARGARARAPACEPGDARAPRDRRRARRPVDRPAARGAASPARRGCASSASTSSSSTSAMAPGHACTLAQVRWTSRIPTARNGAGSRAPLAASGTGPHTLHPDSLLHRRPSWFAPSRRADDGRRHVATEHRRARHPARVPHARPVGAPGSRRRRGRGARGVQRRALERRGTRAAHRAHDPLLRHPRPREPARGAWHRGRVRLSPPAAGACHQAAADGRAPRSMRSRPSSPG